jgi:hypothetical protein
MAIIPRLVNGVFFNFADVMGGQANTLVTALDQSDAGLGIYGGLADAYQAISVGGLFAVTQQVRGVIPATPVAGTYGTVRDQAIIVVRSANYSRQFCVPCPVDSIWLSDMSTLDLSNSLVTDWFSELQTVSGDSYGNPWINMQYGYRRKVTLKG